MYASKIAKIVIGIVLTIIGIILLYTAKKMNDRYEPNTSLFTLIIGLIILTIGFLTFVFGLVEESNVQENLTPINPTALSPMQNTTDFSKLQTYCVKYKSNPPFEIAIDSNVTSCSGDGWQNLFLFRAFNTQQPGTIPYCVIPVYDIDYNATYVTVIPNKSCQNSTDNLQQFTFYAYPSKQPNTIPICMKDAADSPRSLLDYNSESCSGDGWFQFGVFYAYSSDFNPTTTNIR